MTVADLQALELEIVYLEARLEILKKRVLQIKQPSPIYVETDAHEPAKKEMFVTCEDEK